MDGLLRIFARNCEARRIGRETGRTFLDANHRMGGTGCRFCYGLYVSRQSPPGTTSENSNLPLGTLVAVAGFSGPRTWKKEGRTVRSYEWVRYASLEGYAVDGGMGRLLKTFIREVGPDDVMSYADASWSDGEVYRKLGFKEEEPKVFPDGRKSLKFRLELNC